MDNETDKLESAKRQAQAQFESIVEMVEELERAADLDGDYDGAQQTIYDDALSVEVRSDWHNPGSVDDQPAEYRILLCTGGPAVQIVGELNEYKEPETARLQCQDWFQPWTDYRPNAPANVDVDEILLTYARQFYYGG